MPLRREYGTGLPVWVDMWSPDPDASARFYDGVFGWEALDTAPPELGGYRIFSLDGHNVAGLNLSRNELSPPGWRTFFSTDDIERTIAHAEELGAQTAVAAFTISDQGSTALLRDPVGALFGLWEPDQAHGVELVNEPSTLAWNQLVTHDNDRSRTFYETLFSWELRVENHGGPVAYSQWYTGADQAAGGMLHANDLLPVAPPQWLVWFAVTDADAAARRVVELGGRVALPPTPSATGRFAALCDPHGALFTVLESGG